LGSYDLFLCDRVIKYKLRSLLGQEFIKKKRYPIPVIMKDIPQSIVEARDSVACFVPRGTYATVRIARRSQTPEQIVDNIYESAHKIVYNLNGKPWSDVQSISIRIYNSIPFPIYLQ